jgi:long-subunit acyl-CoA synthetase (AMP-forming)
MLSGCQVHRFLILHKELDADDGELTRTRKVRRRIMDGEIQRSHRRALRRAERSNTPRPK